jgi:hypothetical protein
VLHVYSTARAILTTLNNTTYQKYLKEGMARQAVLEDEDNKILPLLFGSYCV